MNSGPGRDSNFVSADKRHHVAVRVAHVELADVFQVGAVLAFGFDVDLPLPSEAVEVVDEQSAHEGLDGAVDVVERDALLEHLVAIDRHELLRHARQERGDDAGAISGRLRAAAMNLLQIVGQELHVVAGAVFQDEGEAAGGADAGNGRRREAERERRPAACASSAIDVLHDRLDTALRGSCGRPSPSA